MDDAADGCRLVSEQQDLVLLTGQWLPCDAVNFDVCGCCFVDLADGVHFWPESVIAGASDIAKDHQQQNIMQHWCFQHGNAVTVCACL